MVVSFDAVKSLLSSWLRDEEGASLVEYILLVALIAVVCIVAIAALGTAAQDKFSKAAQGIQNAQGS